MKYMDEVKKKLKEKGEIYAQIKVRPAASLTKLVGCLVDGTLKVDVAAPARGGLANRALIDWLAKELAADKKNIKIIAGAGERRKLVRVKI